MSDLGCCKGAERYAEVVLLGQSSMLAGINAIARSPLIACQQVDPDTNEPCPFCQRGAAQLAHAVMKHLPLEVRVMQLKDMQREICSVFADH